MDIAIYIVVDGFLETLRFRFDFLKVVDVEGEGLSFRKVMSHVNEIFLKYYY
jgi:hypothetical protein